MKAYLLVALFTFSCIQKAYASDVPPATPLFTPLHAGQCTDKDGVFTDTFSAARVAGNYAACKQEVADMAGALEKQPSGYTGTTVLIVSGAAFLLGVVVTAYVVKK